MRKIKTKLITLAAALCMMLAASPVTALAFVDETAAETETEAEAVLEENVDTAEPDEDTSFSVSGNGEVLDDITDDSTKEFFTITTANGNTYFLVIDRSSSLENVYMLSMIDEYDLQDFLEETEEADAAVTDATQGAVVLEDVDTGTQTEEPEETDDAEVTEGTSSGSMTGIFAVILLIAAGAAGAYFYFRIYRPQHEEDDSEGENMEISDGLEILNEDDFPDAEDDDEEDDE